VVLAASVHPIALHAHRQPLETAQHASQITSLIPPQRFHFFIHLPGLFNLYHSGMQHLCLSNDLLHLQFWPYHQFRLENLYWHRHPHCCVLLGWMHHLCNCKHLLNLCCSLRWTYCRLVLLMLHRVRYLRTTEINQHSNLHPVPRHLLLDSWNRLHCSHL
jgi:hypothetical protein